MVYSAYLLTDTYILSVGVGPLAAAGAGIIAPVLLLLGAVSTTVGSGGAALVSRALGQRDPVLAARVIASAFLMFWVVAGSVTLLGAPFIEPLVKVLGASARVAPYAEDFGRIILLGAITSTGFSAFIRAEGQVHFATAIWVVPVLVNLALCWLFVMVAHWGVSGAALATVAGQAVSAGMGLWYFFLRPRPVRIAPWLWRPHAPLLWEVARTGLPSFAKNASASLLIIVTNHLLRGVGGDTALSVFAVVSRLLSGLLTPQTGLAQGVQPLVGFNVGRQAWDRVTLAVRWALGSTVAYGLLVWAACWCWPSGWINLLSQDERVRREGAEALRLLALAAPFLGVTVLAVTVLQSLGRIREALLLSVGGPLLLKVPVLLVAAQVSLSALWLADAVSEGLMAGVAVWCLHRTRRAWR
nr:MATE family efflux transporter [Deinococcus arboris]